MEKITISKDSYYKKDLGNLMSYEKEVDIQNKLNNYLKITRNMNNMCLGHRTL